MNFDFLLIFLVARYLRTSLKMQQQFPVWDRKVMIVMWASMGLFVASVSVDKDNAIFNWAAHLSLMYCIYILYSEPIFKPAKTILLAIAPYAITATLLDLIKLVAPTFYQSWHNFVEAINLFAVLWGIGVWVVTVRQKKELDKAQEQVAEQEQNNKLISAMKAELEVQVAERTAELTRQKEELEVALNELKSTQAQLIQSEKMASLGELTAGIAHEIQNPLNFVSNFSDVNNELLDEMLAEISNNNADEVTLLVNDIKDNNSKIIFHGKRADAIVKGMLQHSRKNTGQKEPTDINALCDEYMRLSYHGLRAKDKSFNAIFQTYLDPSLSADANGHGKIMIVPQDVGRVLLNLLNNAFYAVNEKKKISGEDYKPTVSIKTTSLPAANAVEIIVEDNGNGVPKALVEKIFQPFFTTKPTGAGTGLGLSLSYDIITKQHGGTINVQSEEGKGTKFTITMPL